jgi:hypothetical protein
MNPRHTLVPLRLNTHRCNRIRHIHIRGAAARARQCSSLPVCALEANQHSDLRPAALRGQLGGSNWSVALRTG